MSSRGGRIALGLLLALTACRRPGPKAQPAGAPSPPTVLGADEVVEVRPGVAVAGPRVSGSLEPRERADVRAEVGGTVERVPAEIGERVQRGQLLARIEDRTRRDELASANTAVRAAAIDVEQARRQVERS